MHRLLLTLLLLGVFSMAHAVGPDPRRDWRSADTEHFRVNYAQVQRAQAERVAGIAERVYARLTRELQWQPGGKIEIVVVDEFDLANGLSTPLPFNENFIFLSPPDEGELLDNSLWLELLLTHELTHTIHLDKVRATPKVIRHIFGRYPLLFPNLFQPGWGIEGVATLNESTPELGQGRLRGPAFEAWMRIEHERGFLSLAEINADGRALPTSKQYLYGVYFYDFLARKYGPEAVYKYIHRYSGNIVPRVHTNPVYATGKRMDELWDEFIADLGAQMAARKAVLHATPRIDGDVILPAHFDVDSLAAVSDGALAVVNDGLTRTRLLHIDARGGVRHLTHIKSGARIDVRPDGMVLIAQPDVCDYFNYYYDLYLWSPSQGKQRLSECGRYRRAVWLGEQHIAALRMEGGVSSLVLLEQRDDKWQESRVLYTTPDQVEAIDLAASPDASHVALAIKQAGGWQVLEFDSAGNAVRVLFDHDAPLYGLHYEHGNDLLLIAVRDNVANLFRYRRSDNRLDRLSHSYTAVKLHSGSAGDGSIVLGVLAAGGTELRRMPNAAPLASATPATRSTALGGTAPPAHTLGDASAYHAWHSMYPRSWLPVSIAGEGLTAIGAMTFGGDTMRWHSYSLQLLREISQQETLGSLSYSFLDSHFLNLSRNLQGRQWSNNEAILYDRTSEAQWASMFPLHLESDLRLFVGLGAAMQTTERVWVAGQTARATNERVAATFLRLDTRDSNWYADGINRGNLTTLLYESYRPFNSHYDGHILRFDTHGYLPLGPTVLSARWSEARAHDFTEPFQLGGSSAHELTQAPMLNQRNLPLRGYLGAEMELRGQNARNAGIQWQTPVIDIDRHAMVPPIGINRISAALFADVGSVWDNGTPRSKYYRSVGVELLGELKLLYILPLPVRIGIARGLDHPGGTTRAYLQLGVPL